MVEWVLYVPTNHSYLMCLVGYESLVAPFKLCQKKKEKRIKRIVAHGQDPPFLKGNYIVAIVFTRTHPTHYYLESSGSTTDMKTHLGPTPSQCMVFLLGN